MLLQNTRYDLVELRVTIQAPKNFSHSAMFEVALANSVSDALDSFGIECEESIVSRRSPLPLASLVRMPKSITSS